jgi:ketosteroid isomerase-like protein
MRRAVVMLIMLAVGALAVPGASAQSDAKSGIAATNKKFEAAAAKGDAAAVAALYTADAWVMPPNGTLTKGPGIAALWKAMVGEGGTSVKLMTQEVEAHGDTAHEVGAYEIKTADGTVVDKGKFIVIWKRDGGEWKLHRDIWNSDMPAPSM